jgi:hypothetical protein
MVTLKVLKKFQDKDNKEKIYQVGETLSTSDLDRVNNLVSRGICSISAIKEANKEEKKPEKISLFDKEFEIGAVKGALAEIGVSINKNAAFKQSPTNSVNLQKSKTRLFLKSYVKSNL